MEALTCLCPGDDQHKHGPTCALTDSPMPSPFLCIPSSFSHSVLTDHKFDITISPVLITRALPSPLSFASDSKSFYTAFEADDINITDSEASSPESPCFPGDTFDSEEEMENPLESSAPASPVSITGSSTFPARSSLEQVSKQSNKARQRISGSSKERRSKSQTPDASRSSSISGTRSSAYRNRAGPYRQSHSSRTVISENQFKPQREERDLLALHRESCRLFESFCTNTKSLPPFQRNGEEHSRSGPIRSSTEPTHNTYDTKTRPFTRRSSAGSPSRSPVLLSQRPLLSPATSEELSPDFQEKENWAGSAPKSPVSDDTTPAPETKPAYELIPPTVIDWTSPSTRRREYAKIDRSSRGIRGMWRKLAPKWCQSKSQRLLFFDEAKRGRQEYEGSVRRFRMDLPNDGEHPDRTKTPMIVTEKETAAESRKSCRSRIRVLTNDDDSDGSSQHGTRDCFGLRRSSRA